MIRLAVFTSDSHLWAMQGFAHQWKKYSNLPLDVVGFTKPDFDLPKNFSFVSMGKFEDYPSSKWSDVLINYLNQVKESYVGLFLEDYWLIRQANTPTFMVVEALMNAYPNILRFDLTTDRLYCGNISNFMSFYSYDIIKAEVTNYHLSLQASVFNKKKLLEVIKPGMSPWQMELDTLPFFKEHPDDYWVLGTRQFPFNYQIMIAAGQFRKDGSWMFPARQLFKEDYDELEKLGFTKKPGEE